MKLKDKYGSVINFQQAKNGKIIIPFADHVFTLSRHDTGKITLYDIEDFNLEDYEKAYMEPEGV